jgi:hypothetical protein
MSNMLAQLKLSLVYEGPSGETIVLKDLSVNSPYQACVNGTIDVPNGTLNTAVVHLDFGSLSNVTMMVIQNRTGQEIVISINQEDESFTVSHNLPDGAVWIPIAASGAPVGTNVTSVQIKTTGTQVGAGLISYRLFGDAT